MAIAAIPLQQYQLLTRLAVEVWRHVSLSMLAFAMTAVIQHHANAKTPFKNAHDPPAANPTLIRWCVQEIRYIANEMEQRQIEPSDIIAWSV